MPAAHPHWGPHTQPARPQLAPMRVHLPLSLIHARSRPYTDAPNRAGRRPSPRMDPSMPAARPHWGPHTQPARPQIAPIRAHPPPSLIHASSRPHTDAPNRAGRQSLLALSFHFACACARCPPPALRLPTSSTVPRSPTLQSPAHPPARPRSTDTPNHAGHHPSLPFHLVSRARVHDARHQLYFHPPCRSNRSRAHPRTRRPSLTLVRLGNGRNVTVQILPPRATRDEHVGAAEAWRRA